MAESIKISIVTPVYNCKDYIERCILSIKNQVYSNYEHIIIDGGSTDGTLDIIKKYVGTYNMCYISEKDQGMYDAIYKGFAIATGDVFAWLNADDMYMPWAFQVVENVFVHHPEVKWLTGIPSDRNEDDVCFKVAMDVKPFHRKWIQKGYYDGRIVLRFLQQESIFFVRELWEKHGELIKSYRLSGDFHLWQSFSKDADLYMVKTVISSFRTRKDQQSEDKEKYYKEIGVERGRIFCAILRRILAMEESFFMRGDNHLLLNYKNE